MTIHDILKSVNETDFFSACKRTYFPIQIRQRFTGEFIGTDPVGGEQGLKGSKYGSHNRITLAE